MTSLPLQERVDELEARLAFLDDTMTALNQVVATQDRLLHRLLRDLGSLRGDVQTLRHGLASDPGNEPPPPHY